jgi:hypothetical protein
MLPLVVFFDPFNPTNPINSTNPMNSITHNSSLITHNSSVEIFVLFVSFVVKNLESELWQLVSLCALRALRLPVRASHTQTGLE